MKRWAHRSATAGAVAVITGAGMAATAIIQHNTDQSARPPVAAPARPSVTPRSTSPPAAPQPSRTPAGRRSAPPSGTTPSSAPAAPGVPVLAAGLGTGAARAAAAAATTAPPAPSPRPTSPRPSSPAPTSPSCLAGVRALTISACIRIGETTSP